MVTVESNKKFLRVVTDLGIMAAGAVLPLDLSAIRRDFGHDLNTISLKNNDAVEFLIYLDGKEVIYLASGDFLGLDWEDGIIFTDVRVKNADGAAASVANKLRISVGRTGPQ